MKSDTILNIGAGRFDPLYLEDSENYFIVNLDRMYRNGVDSGTIEAFRNQWTGQQTETYKVLADIYDFLESTTMTFERICMYRFLEHVPMGKVLYFIYLLSNVTKEGAEIDVIVPNYEILAQMILDEQKGIEEKTIEFEPHNIELTTELLNDPNEPHASIWTLWRAKYFFELEGRFQVFDSCTKYEYDGRELYLRFLARRL